MKKLFTQLVCLVAMLLPLTAAAKTVTITADNPEAVQVMDYSTYQYLTLETPVTISESAALYVMPTDGYELASVTINGTAAENADETYAYLTAAELTDGCQINVATRVKEAKVYTIHGDPEKFTVSANYNDYEAVDGVWTISLMDATSINFNCKGSYVINSIVDASGRDYLNDYSRGKRYANIYSSNFEENELWVNCGDLNELRTLHVAINVVGDPSKVKVTRNGSYEAVPVDEFANLGLVPESELPLAIQSANYNQNLYKVELNGVAQESKSYYSFGSLNEGDIITVYTDFPDIDVPVHFTFTNPGTEGAIKAVSVNGEYVQNQGWLADGFTVKMGASFNIETNTNAYQFTEFLVNDFSQSFYGYYGTVESDEINVVVTATKIPGYKVTINCDPEAVGVYADYYHNEPYTLTGESTVIEVAKNSYIYIAANDGYVLTGVYEGEDNLGSQVSVWKDGMVIDVYADKFERDNVAMVYLDPSSEWNYKELTLNYNNYDLRKVTELRDGYNMVFYHSSDLPFYLGLYPYDAVVYLNGEKIEKDENSSAYNATSQMESGAVIKIFHGEAPVHKVTFDIHKDANVMMHADYVTELDGSEHHTVGYTHVVITPVDTYAESTDAGVVVKANGTKVEPLDDGRYIVEVNADTNIKVSPAGTTGIGTIEAEAGETVIYNLQGIRVDKPGKGLYIVNGKKVIF